MSCLDQNLAKLDMVHVCLCIIVIVGHSHSPRSSWKVTVGCIAKRLEPVTLLDRVLQPSYSYICSKLPAWQ